MAHKRVFIDAPDDLRCEATIKLRDGSEARCGRFWVSGNKDGRLLCTQHRKIASAEARKGAHGVMVGRVLDPSDSFCPKCGHKRDKSCVSSIDHGDGRQSCQKCGTEWTEAADALGVGGKS